MIAPQRQYQYHSQGSTSAQRDFSSLVCRIKTVAVSEKAGNCSSGACARPNDLGKAIRERRCRHPGRRKLWQSRAPDIVQGIAVQI